MFENMEQKNQGADPVSTPRGPVIPQAPGVEDIFSQTENQVSNGMAPNKPIQAPPMSSAPSAAERVGLKRIILFVVLIFVIIALVFIGFLLVDKLLTPQYEPVVTVPEENNSINSEQEETVTTETEEAIATTTEEMGGVDTDGDGLTDDEELSLGTHSDNIDTDLDGLTDYEEVVLYDTDPLDPDTDADGFMDGSEVENLQNPKGEGDLATLPNGVKIKREYGDLATTTEQEVSSLDTDGDGLLDADEIKAGTDINNSDTDADELDDYNEVMVYGTDPLNPDTDGDTYLDGAEVKNGYNPNGDGKLF